MSNGANINSSNKYQRTPLMIAAYSGDTQLITLLIEKQADIELID